MRGLSVAAVSLGMLTACTGKGEPQKAPTADGKDGTVVDDSAAPSADDDAADTKAEADPDPGPEVEIYGGPRMTAGEEEPIMDDAAEDTKAEDTTAEQTRVESPPKVYGGPRMNDTGPQFEAEPQPRIYGAPRRRDDEPNDKEQ